MKRCEICQTEMAQVFQEYYCPNHDKHNVPVAQGLEHLCQEAADGSNPSRDTDIRPGCLYKGLSGNLFVLVVKFENPLLYDFAVSTDDAKTWVAMNGVYNPSRLQFLSEIVPASLRPLAESLGLKLKYDDDETDEKKEHDAYLNFMNKELKEACVIKVREILATASSAEAGETTKHARVSDYVAGPKSGVLSLGVQRVYEDLEAIILLYAFKELPSEHKCLIEGAFKLLTGAEKVIFDWECKEEKDGGE